MAFFVCGNDVHLLTQQVQTDYIGEQVYVPNLRKIQGLQQLAQQSLECLDDLIAGLRTSSFLLFYLDIPHNDESVLRS